MVQMSSDNKFIVTSARGNDTDIKFWNLQGELLGQCGQPEPITGKKWTDTREEGDGTEVKLGKMGGRQPKQSRGGV